MGITQNNTEQNTDIHGKLLHADLSYQVRGVAFDIRKKYGPGQKESVYHNLMDELFVKNNTPVKREGRIKIFSEETGKTVGYYQPDFIVDDKVIIEVKSSRFTTKTDEKQLYHYLRNSKYEIGFLINFSTPRLYIKRMIYTNDRKPFLRYSV